MPHQEYSVAVLEKGDPFSENCALPYDFRQTQKSCISRWFGYSHNACFTENQVKMVFLQQTLPILDDMLTKEYRVFTKSAVLSTVLLLLSSALNSICKDSRHYL